MGFMMLTTRSVEFSSPVPRDVGKPEKLECCSGASGGPAVQELQHHQMFSDSHPKWNALQILPDGAGIWSQPFLVVVHCTVKPDNS